MDSFLKEQKSPKTNPKTIKDAWNSLVNRQDIVSAYLRPEIAASWDRCLNLNIDPSAGISPPDIGTEEILNRNKEILSYALPHMQDLFDLLDSEGILVILYSPEAYILSLFGSAQTLKKAEDMNVFMGVSHTEAYLGTFAPGICLVEGRAIQVRRFEHYRSMYHDWSCSAAPIFNGERELLGVLNITSIDGKEHSEKLLNLVVLSVAAIEMEMRHAAMGEKNRQLHQCLTSLVNDSPEALLVFDKDNIITHLNPKAQKILGASETDVLEEDATRLIANFQAAKKGLASGRKFIDLIFFPNSHKKIKVEASLKEISHDEANYHGIVSLLRAYTSSKDKDKDSKIASFHDFIHQSVEVKELLENASSIAETDHTVLIQGESGTGKEILAHSIHKASSRCHGPFVVVNCAAIPKELIQSEFFGYEGGTFTGADRTGRMGKFEHADGGTIFLDEIGDMSLEGQASLLRILQDKVVVKLGGVHGRKIDARIITATNIELLDAVKKGLFREDLYYRISAVPIRIAPLRERKEDIKTLMEHFVAKYTKGVMGYEDIDFDEKSQEAIFTYDWPGNVRELENTVIRFLTIMKGNKVRLKDLPETLMTSLKNLESNSNNESQSNMSLELSELDLIRKALKDSGGHISKTAERLGIHRVTLYRKLKKYRQEGVSI